MTADRNDQRGCVRNGFEAKGNTFKIRGSRQSHYNVGTWRRNTGPGRGNLDSAGYPIGEYLARVMWAKAFGEVRSPLDAGRPSLREVSQCLPIVFELVSRRLGEKEFIEALRENLYANVKYPDRDSSFMKSSESLAVLARLMVQEHKRKEGCRIDAVVTLNADDLLERGVRSLAPETAFAKLRHSDNRALHTFAPGGLRLIPVYHIHGFLPARRKQEKESDQRLVFTDTQYWSTSASSLTLANRVMASALSESWCIFIGLSMTDINLLRWLALRTYERDLDLFEVNKNSHFSEAEQPYMPRLDDTSGFGLPQTTLLDSYQNS